MRPPHEEHIRQEQYEAACRDRDRWAATAMEQHQYVLQLEQRIRDLEKQLGMETVNKELFSCITQEAYDNHKALAVEDEMKSACGSAAKLAKVIRTNEALGYLNTRYMSSTELYELLNAHFRVSFKLRAFQTARCR